MQEILGKQFLNHKYKTMPFKKTKSGKYKSPSGKTYTAKQVKRYYASKQKSKKQL